MHALRNIAFVGATVVVMSAIPESSADAQLTPAAVGHSTEWYAGIATGEYFAIKDWPSTYRLGGGGELIVGREMAPGWSAQVSVNQWLQAGSQHTTWDLKAAPMVRWMGRGEHLRPFGLVGVGIDVQSEYPARSTSGRAMLPLGAGLDVPTSRSASVFIETMYYVLFGSAATRDVPLLLGFRVGFH